MSGDPRYEGSGVGAAVTHAASAATSATGGELTDDESRRKEIYTYEADWVTNALAWSARRDKPFRLAVASYIEEYANRVDVIGLNEERNVLERTCSFQHPYPSTKILFCPDARADRPDLLATTGDYVRLWEIGPTGSEATMKSCLNNNRKSDFCAPLTSFDWNVEDARKMVTASIDTTCSIWDLEKETATQLIAHDKEVFDVAFAKGTDIFGSVGADGSVRLFDTRNLEHSTILYETEGLAPVLRISWNRQDANYLAVIQVESPGITLLDVRVPSIPVATLSSHQASVNAIQWAPHSSCHLCSAADDSQALIWDLSALPKPIEDPILAYPAGSEINSLHWSSLHTAWISISFGKKVQILRV